MKPGAHAYSVSGKFVGRRFAFLSVDVEQYYRAIGNIFVFGRAVKRYSPDAPHAVKQVCKYLLFFFCLCPRLVEGGGKSRERRGIHGTCFKALGKQLRHLRVGGIASGSALYKRIEAPLKAWGNEKRAGALRAVKSLVPGHAYHVRRIVRRKIDAVYSRRLRCVADKQRAVFLCRGGKTFRRQHTPADVGCVRDHAGAHVSVKCAAKRLKRLLVIGE